jgi:hypothetical protein
MLDESEVETIPDAQPLAFEPETGETTEPAEIPEPGNPAASWADKPSAVGETLKQALHATKGKPRDITPTPAKADIKPGKDVISEAQRKRLWATAKEHGWSDDQLKAWLLQQFGIESTKAIPWVKYDEIIQRLRQGPAGEQHPF